MGLDVYQVLQAEPLSETTFLWEVFAPDVAKAARPGQFVMLRLDEGGERIPLTIADFDAERGTVTLVTQAVGKTTRAMRGYTAGDWFRDLVGPLGVPSEIPERGHVVVVGGGLGVAPIYPQLRAFHDAGLTATVILGFRSRDHVFFEERFAAIADELILCTDDGSHGRPGLVTDALADVVARPRHVDRVVAVGPMAMMRACAEVTREAGIPTIVSLNTIMVDGTGMCGSCRVTVGGAMRFSCVDGPEFDGHAVDFDELMRRQGRFGSEERRADRDYAQICELEHLLVVEGKRNYKKLAQLPPKARPMPERKPDERARTFDEVSLGYGIDDALAEADRCIQCVKPTCISGCPVAIDIPGFIRRLLLRDLSGALATISESNLFPSICGRVCPQESQCEAQCILAKKMEPVAIGRLERFVGDHAPRRVSLSPPKRRDGKRVAVVGSGPAGLACAGDLARAGVEVVVYEALHALGGVLRYGIPAFRLPRDIMDGELERLEELGVRFEVNKVVGRTFTVAQLRGAMGYDAVFIAVGAGAPVFLGIEGEQARQVVSANELLTRVNLMSSPAVPQDTPAPVGEHVVVLGGGNTALDCARVARRRGADVHVVYRRTEAEAPARREELRHAREEGIHFHFLRSPHAIETDADGNVTALVADRMQLGEPDASGRRRPEIIEGERERFACDTVVYALGTRANPIIPRNTEGLSVNRWGYVEADEGQATSLPGVFAGGDIVTGGATVILAMGAGRQAARSILAWLDDEGVWPPEIATEGEPSTPRGHGQCPRCGRPIEGDEAYICCADEAVRWRCEACHKRWEGFAFPYGLCPACGGALAHAEPLGTSSETLEAIRQAVAIELGGQAFYARGAEETDDPELKVLFTGLAEMERDHLHELLARYHLPTPEPTASPSMAALAVYGHVEPPKDPVDLLELAVTIERRARDFFAAQARALDDDHPAWRVYRELEAEEHHHVAILQTELRRVKTGRAGTIIDSKVSSAILDHVAGGGPPSAPRPPSLLH